MHHRRDLLGLRKDILEAEGVAMPMVEGDVAVFSPCVRDVEIVAYQYEAARDVQRVRCRRRIEKQRMRRTRGAVVLKHSDVVDTMSRFTPIANPPQGFFLRSTISLIVRTGAR